MFILALVVLGWATDQYRESLGLLWRHAFPITQRLSRDGSSGSRGRNDS